MRKRGRKWEREKERKRTGKIERKEENETDREN
jgi:hypothetical protein